MIKNLIIIVVILLIFSSCKNQIKSGAGETNEKNATTSLDIVPEKENPDLKPLVIERNLSEDRSKAKKEINDILSSEQVIPEFLTANYFLVDFISEGGMPRDIIDIGEWYKFNKNNTYEHGFFARLNEKGKYAFTLSTEILILCPDLGTSAPEEWKVLNSKDIIVLSGTSKFGNNNLQKHMQNVKQKPVLK